MDEDDDDEDDFGDNEPVSFSEIDPVSLHAKEIPEEFELLADATKITFDVKKGEMLYLPACVYNSSSVFFSFVCSFSGNLIFSFSSLVP